MLRRLAPILLTCISLIIIAVIALTLADYWLPGNAGLVRPEFERQRMQWEAADIDHYEMTIWLRNPGSMLIFCPPAVVEVRSNKVVKVEAGHYPDDIAVDHQKLGQDCLKYNYSTFEEVYSAMTIDQLFEIIEDDFDNSIYKRASFGLHYNHDYGFPVAIFITGQIDHVTSYSILDFKVLP